MRQASVGLEMGGDGKEFDTLTVGELRKETIDVPIKHT